MNKNNVGILLAVLGIAAAIAGYFGIYQNFTAKKDELVVANDALQTEVDHLQDLADHKQEYLDETASMKAQNEEIIGQFPAEVRTEDEILHVKQTEDTFGIKVGSISMPDSTIVEVARPAAEVAEAAPEEGTEEAAATEEGEVVEDTAAEAAAPQVMLYKTPVACSIETSYSAIKDVLEQFVMDNVNKKSVESLSLAFSGDTGELVGALSYSMYSLTGTDKTYSEPSIPGIAYGTSDFFNTAQRNSELAAQRAAEQAENTSAQ